MKPHSSFTIIAVTSLSFLISCRGKEGLSGPALKGNITGFVELHAENFSVITNHGGVAVSAEGMGASATTGADGKWMLSNVSTGTYTIVFSKSSFGITKVIGFQFSGGGDAYLGKTILIQKPTYSVNSISVSLSSDFYVSGVISSPSYPVYGSSIALFIDTTNSVSADPKRYLYHTPAYAPPSTTLYELRMSFAQLRDFVALPSGVRIYIAAYAAAAGYLYSAYPDIATGRFIYTAISDSSKTSSFIMP